MTKKKIVCEYCDSVNNTDIGTCLACGAPLIVRFPRPATKSLPVKSKQFPQSKPESRPEAQLLKVGEKAEEGYFAVMNTYAIAWRTLGEAVAIAVAGFILGFVGGATEMFFPGVFFAMALGVAVGLTRKNFYLVLASAPVGTLIGLAVGAIPWVLGSAPQVMVFSAGVFAIIGALTAGRKNLPFGRRNWWEKARPFLGGLGGFLFGLLGALLGWGMISTIQTIFSI